MYIYCYNSKLLQKSMTIVMTVNFMIKRANTKKCQLFKNCGKGWTVNI